MTPDGKRIRAIRYQADFSYEKLTVNKARIEERSCSESKVVFIDQYTANRRPVVEDVKSKATMTRVYSIKKKLMREKFDIEVLEV